MLNSASDCRNIARFLSRSGINPGELRAGQLVLRDRRPQVKHRAAGLQIQRSIQGHQLKHVAVGRTGGGQGALVADALESPQQLPWRAPLASCGARSNPAGRALSWGGMLNSNQCTQLPAGASGSSSSSAKLPVPLGAPLQRSGGERFRLSPL